MRNSYCILSLFFLSLLVTTPLFHGKIILAHDMHYAFIKTVSMYQSWTYGDFVARWTPDILQGYGYPSFNYYGPLFFAITAALSKLVNNLVWGFNLGLFLAFFASACAMYFYAKELWGKEGGFLSAVAYLFAPYHFVELYVRGACGELTAMVFIPLTFYAFHRLSVAPKTFYFFTASIALTGLILSHNITAMFCFPLFFAYAVIIIAQKKFSIRWALLYLLVGVVALGLSSYFWVPALLEKDFVQINRILQGYDYRQHFLYWDQLLYCPWNNDRSGPGRADGMPFHIGPLHLVLVFILLVRYRHLNLKNTPSRIYIIFWFIVALLATLMTLNISAFIWKMIPLFHLASLPWRFLLLTCVAVSLLAGGVCVIFKKHRVMVCLWGVALIILANFYCCHNFGYEDTTKTLFGITNSKAELESVLSNMAKGVPDPKKFLQDSTPQDAMEYLPKDVKILRMLPSKDKLEVIKGAGKILNYTSSSGLQHSYTFLASTPTVLFFHSFYFPGWEVLVDKKITPIFTENPFGLIAFAVPEGKHLIEVNFENTPIHSILQRLSLIILIILIILLLYRNKIDAFLLRRK